MIARALWLAIALAGCSAALHEPPPVSALAPGHRDGRSVDELMTNAEGAWARRMQPGQAKIAQDLYLDAAAADDKRADALLGAMRALTFRIEHEHDVDKGALAQRQVELGQWCQRRAPTSAECDYRLAIALGQQARERPSTGRDAMDHIVTLLHRAIARDAKLESGGPHRVLAMVLLRAPAWPVGPGDPEAALDEAKQAIAIAPDAPDNQLTLGEALAATEHDDLARQAYAKALALARSAKQTGNPEADGWIAEASKKLR